MSCTCSSCGCQSTSTSSCTSCGTPIVLPSWNDIKYKPDYVSPSEQIYVQETELSSTQILALFTTPIEILPNPGPDKVNFIVGILLKNTFGTVAYVSANALRFRFGSKTEIYEAGTGFLTAVADTYLQVPAKESSTTENSAVNEALYAYVPVADPTAGDGTITVKVLYRTIIF